MLVRIVRASILALAAPLVVGCVESAAHEKAKADLAQAQQVSWQQGQRIRALEWQLASLAQQAQQSQQRYEVAYRALSDEVQKLNAANAALAERLKAEEAKRLELAPIAADEKAQGGARAQGSCSMREADLRRLLGAIDARNAQVTEALARLEKRLQEQGSEQQKPGRSPRPPIDVVDPWGFGGRH